MGVFYHLKDPLLAFARLRQLMKEGAIILVEGEVFHSADSYAKFFWSKEFAAGDDYSNWFVSMVSCLRERVQVSFVEIAREYLRDVIYNNPNYWKNSNGFGSLSPNGSCNPARCG